MRPAPVAPDRVTALRAAVLRPGLSAETAIFAGDDEPDTLHVAILRGGEAVSVASVIRERTDRVQAVPQWRIRGMATLPELRGRGMGTVLLGALEQHARAHGGEVLWCFARPAARPLYERAGLAVEGEPFELPPIGPHVLMTKALERAYSCIDFSTRNSSMP